MVHAVLLHAAQGAVPDALDAQVLRGAEDDERLACARERDVDAAGVLLWLGLGLGLGLG